MKKNIPNILTISRIIITFIIIILSIFKLWSLIIILSIIASISDFLDGKIARRYNLITKKGAALDTIADKVFAIGLTISLISYSKKVLIFLILEIIIIIINIYCFYKTNKINSLKIGKFKTFFLFTTLVFYFINLFTKKVGFIVDGLVLSTINLQVLSIIYYFIYALKSKKEIEFKIIKEEEKESSDLIDLAKSYGTIDNEEINNY